MRTIQDALKDAQLLDAKAQQTLAPEPTASSQRFGLPKWLTRGGISTGPVGDFINPIHGDTGRVWLVNEKARSYSQVLDIMPEPNLRFAKVWLDGEAEPRKFRLDVKVRYVITPLGKGRK